LIQYILDTLLVKSDAQCPISTSQETPSQKLEEKVGISTGLMINSLMVEPVEDSGT
jgi:hypothetical protein